MLDGVKGAAEEIIRELERLCHGCEPAEPAGLLRRSCGVCNARRGDVAKAVCYLPVAPVHYMDKSISPCFPGEAIRFWEAVTDRRRQR